MKKTVSITIALALLVLVAVLGFIHLRSKLQDEQVAEEIEAGENPVVTASNDGAAKRAPIETAPELVEDNQEQVAATRRMYMVHAPLRAPEIANPDSEANREILETMVTKALIRSGSVAAGISSNSE